MGLPETPARVAVVTELNRHNRVRELGVNETT